jgi:uncharacterized surface protein with fasciclin (FAS1) repeats
MFRFSKTLLAAIVTATITFSAATVLAQKDPEVGGAAMYPTKNIAQNTANSQDHTTLVAAVKAAGLVTRWRVLGHSRSLRPPTKPLPNFPQAPWTRY